MGKNIRVFLSTLFLIGLITFGITWWYKNLDPRKKQFIQNLVKQVPDLPARYLV